MTHEVNIHEAQTKILRELLFLPSASYTVLQQASGLESDRENTILSIWLSWATLKSRERITCLVQPVRNTQIKSIPMPA